MLADSMFSYGLTMSHAGIASGPRLASLGSSLGWVPILDPFWPDPHHIQLPVVGVRPKGYMCRGQARALARAEG